MAWLEKRSMLVGAVATVLVGGALVPAFAMAQSSDDEADVPDVTCAAPHRVMLHDDVLAEVAVTLGVDEETLRAAVESVREDLQPGVPPVGFPFEGELATSLDEFHAALAAELGVSSEDVTAAFDAAKPTDEEIAAAQAERLANLTERLAEAVASGRLTQDEADEILERIESGEGPGRGFGLGRGLHHRGAFGFEGFFRGPADEAGTPTAVDVPGI